VVLDSDRDLDGDGRIDDALQDVMEIAVASDGRVFSIERAGKLKAWSPVEGKSAVVGQLSVFTGMEDGLLGLALDPRFDVNHWLYLFYSEPDTHTNAAGSKAGTNRVSRFTLEKGLLDPTSERVLVRIPTQRDECCHSAGSLAFDAAGNLYASVGDNTHPGASDGYSPLDERPGRGPWNSQKSASNANDLRGKILRIHPEPDGTATIPAGNLFPPGTPNTRPEIYVMGNRNPFRISVDPRNAFLYWGEVGPDAGGANTNRGPAGFDEINQARVAGNFGWPYFAGDNKPYRRYDFATRAVGEPFDPERPVNESIYNTGPKVLPPAQPAFIWYPYGPSTKFPAVNGGGGRTACAGPVYYFDEKLNSATKLPREFDHTLFIYEWSRNWILAVHLDKDENIARKPDGSLWMDRFCSGMTFKRPMDMAIGPDGCLYVLENGTAWNGNLDTQIVRIEHVAGAAGGAAGISSPLPCDGFEKPRYTAYRVTEPITIDGRLEEEAWKRVPRSPSFRDILTGEPTMHDTRVAVMWDEKNLYVGFWVEEPNVAATFKERDSPIYYNNDVEVFIAGQDAYYEFEINAYNTIYEVLFFWEDAYEKGGYSGQPEFRRGRPHSQGFNGVGFTKHPRGKRIGFFDWDFPGLQTAVHVDGSLNDPADKDRGWTVELAFPWEGMKWLAKGDGRSLPPKDGDVWRIDFSRFNQYKAPAPARDSGGWFWSPHGVWDSHIPECFPYIRFSRDLMPR
jgi:cytochrome c